MNKLHNVSYTVLILLVIGLLLLNQYFKVISPKKNIIDDIHTIDINGDGIVSRKELKYYLSRIEEEKNTNYLTSSDFIKSGVGGLIRGFLMGCILFDIEGGVTLGIMLGVLNPIISGVTKLL
jgi:hypothetical protein